MKGHIQLGTFIHQVKKELVEAQNNEEEPFYALDSVDLEVSFVLETSGKGKSNLFVIALEGEAKASQTHKVILRLTPLRKKKPNVNEDEDPTPGKTVPITVTEDGKIVFDISRLPLSDGIIGKVTLPSGAILPVKKSEKDEKVVFKQSPLSDEADLS